MQTIIKRLSETLQRAGNLEGVEPTHGEDDIGIRSGHLDDYLAVALIGKMLENGEMEIKIQEKSKPYLAKLLHLEAPDSRAYSAEMPANNATEAGGQSGWIPADGKHRLPEEKENPITRDFYTYPVTVEICGQRDIRYYAYGRGHWWHGPGHMDHYVKAWMDIQGPYTG